MADMNPLSDVLNGDPADATDVQNNFQTIEVYINGVDLVRTDGTEVMTANLDVDSNKVVNLADGTASSDAVNKGQLDAAAPPGAWTLHTTQIDQGASSNIAKTVSYSKYIQIGKTVIWNFSLLVTGTGTSGSSVTLTLPVTAALTGGVRGSGMIYNDSANQDYAGMWTGESTTTVALRGDWSSNNGWGTQPNVPIDAGDVIRGSITYEAA